MPTIRTVLLALLVPFCLALLAAGCSSFEAKVDSGPVTITSGRDDRGDLLGAGASFPSVVYQGWFYDYHELASGVRVNYQSIGSGAGIQQFIEGTVDFGATDAPMSDGDMAKVPNVQHLPTVLGAVVVAYNLPGVSDQLRLDADTVSAVFRGEITAWNDPAIAALNPGVSLPSTTLSVLHRSDSSGTSYVFTDWLTKATDSWDAIGTSKSPNWPVGIGGQGNEGVAALLRSTPGAIGYVELNYLSRLNLPGAAIENGSGEFVSPSLESVSAAAAGVELPEDYRVSLTAVAGPGAYPISSFTYLLIDREQENCDKARVLLHLLYWVYNAPDASALAVELEFVPLPDDVRERVNATLHEVTCKGVTVLPGDTSTS